MIESSKVKVLIVDDSSFIRSVLNDILNSHPKIEVIGMASNGKAAIRMLGTLEPDVITLDVEMPLMNGFETLKELHQVEKYKDIPVIMFSSLTASGAEATIKALELGAFDFMQKPENASQVQLLKEDLYAKVLSAGEVRRKRKPTVFSSKIIKPSDFLPRQREKYSGDPKTVIIAISTGGPKSLNSVIPFIPANLPARIIVVQHMPAKFTETLAERFDKISQTRVSEAKDGEELKLGHIYIAPGNYHMCVNSRHKVELNQGPQVCGVRPSADVTMKSCVEVYGGNIISVVMTGMGNDGTNGTIEIKKKGGYCIAQDEETSIIYGMPRSVVKLGLANEIVPLEQIADRIVKAVNC